MARSINTSSGDIVATGTGSGSCVKRSTAAQNEHRVHLRIRLGEAPALRTVPTTSFVARVLSGP